MRLNFIPYLTKEERAALKPVPGDTVIYEGKKYRVVSVGLKYLNVEPLDKPGVIYIVKIAEVYKDVPVKSDEQRGPRADDIAFDFLK